MLLIRRSDNDNWAVPGGAIDLGESMVQAAVRETREETGIDCEVTGLVGIYTDPRHVMLYTSNGEVRQEFSIVLTARATGGEPTRSEESSEVRWVPRVRTSTAIRWIGRCGCGSGTTSRDGLRRTWAELSILWSGWLDMRSRRIPMYRVAQRMERLARWPMP